MSSLILHIVSSNIIKSKYNLSDEFLAGAIMPDIIKKMTGDKILSHYMKLEKIDTEVKGNFNKLVVEAERYIKENENEMNSQIKIGYAAHLIEDKIWFEHFVNRYADYSDGTNYVVRFVKDKKMHTDAEFAEKIYNDYTIIDEYMLEKYNLNIDEIRNKILPYYSDVSQEIIKKVLVQPLKSEYKTGKELYFISYNDAEEFVERSSKGVEKLLGSYLEG